MFGKNTENTMVAEKTTTFDKINGNPVLSTVAGVLIGEAIAITAKAAWRGITGVRKKSNDTVIRFDVDDDDDFTEYDEEETNADETTEA